MLKLKHTLLALLCVGPWAVAQESYVVGVEDHDYYPHYRTEGGNYQGFARDLLDLFAKEQGISLVYKPLPLVRLFPTFFAGEVDLKYPDNPQWQQDARAGLDIHYSEPVVSAIDGVMVLPARLGNPADQLQTLGTVRGFTPWSYFDRIKAGTLKVQEVTSFLSSLEQGLNGRVEGVYMNTDVARYLLSENLKQPGALVFDENLPYDKGNYLLSSIKHGALIEQFNAFLANNGAAITALKAQYKLE